MRRKGLPGWLTGLLTALCAAGLMLLAAEFWAKEYFGGSLFSGASGTAVTVLLIGIAAGIAVLVLGSLLGGLFGARAQDQDESPFRNRFAGRILSHMNLPDPPKDDKEE